MRNGDRSFAINAGNLARDLPRAFKVWLTLRLPRPSQASRVVLEYLEHGGPNVDVRGLQRASEREPSFWIQLSFSGCAGEAQVSADVAAHWAASWHRSCADEISEVHLKPFGFVPDEPEPPQPDEIPVFLPAGQLGYLELNAPATRSPYQLPMFELDHSLEEAFGEDAEQQQLERRFAPFVIEGSCRCQLCEPTLGALAAPASDAVR